MKLLMSIMAFSTLPAVAWAQSGDQCAPGSYVEFQDGAGVREGYVLEQRAQDGACLLEIDGLLYRTTEWIAGSSIAGNRDSVVTAAPETVATPSAGCLPGQSVDIEWQGSWYAGMVVDGPRPDGTCYITYDGYDSSWDEWVTPDRLRLVGGALQSAQVCSPGRSVRIEWRGQWYDGWVLEGPQSDGRCYITYDGYDSSWDEWVTPDRLLPVY